MKNILGQAVQITLNYHAGIAPTNATASDHERVVNHTTRVRLMLLISLASGSPRARTEARTGRNYYVRRGEANDLGRLGLTATYVVVNVFERADRADRADRPLAGHARVQEHPHRERARYGGARRRAVSVTTPRITRTSTGQSNRQ